MLIGTGGWYAMSGFENRKSERRDLTQRALRKNTEIAEKRVDVSVGCEAVE